MKTLPMNGVETLSERFGPEIPREELLKLRQACLQAERKSLEARLAKNGVDALLVGLEARYGPLAAELAQATSRPTANLDEGLEGSAQSGLDSGAGD